MPPNVPDVGCTGLVCLVHVFLLNHNNHDHDYRKHYYNFRRNSRSHTWSVTHLHLPSDLWWSRYHTWIPHLCCWRARARVCVCVCVAGVGDYLVCTFLQIVLNHTGNPCPTNFPVMQEFGDSSHYYCYLTNDTNGAVCSYKHGRIAAPAGGTWGFDEQDCAHAASGAWPRTRCWHSC